MEEQKTEFIVRKKDKTENFSIIYNACLRDNSISWQAKGLFGYLMTLPNDWEIYKTELPNHASNGRDATIKAFDELIEKGYITVEETKGENGKFGKKIYKVFEVSQGETKIIRKRRNADKKEAPLLNNRYLDTVTGNPLTVNQELLNTDIQNTNKLKTNTKFSESDDSDFPEDPNEIKTKKTNKPHRLTKTELTKQYLSSLTLETYNASRRCAYNLIQYLIKLQNSSTAATNLDSWQRDFAQFAATEKKDFNEIVKVIDYVFHDNYWMSRISSAPAIIKNYGMFYQRMNGTSTKSNYQQKQEEAIGRVAMNTDKDYSL